MGQIKYIGKCIPKVEDFLAYMLKYPMGAWRPDFVTMHHTGNPDLDIWTGFKTRKSPIDDQKWMGYLASFYGSPAYDAKGRMYKGAWTTGPQFFITPANFCVLSPPEKPGTHAAQFNRNSWGVECVGNFDVKKDIARFVGPLRQRYVDGLAALHIVLGKDPGGYVRTKSGLHFHRDDTSTSKSCPGTGIGKAEMVKEIRAAMVRLSGNPAPIKGDEQAGADKVVPVAKPQTGRGKVVKVAKNDVLNVRAGAGAKNPLVGTLKPGTPVEIVGEARNGPTLWFEIDIPGDANGFVSANYIERA